MDVFANFLYVVFTEIVKEKFIKFEFVNVAFDLTNVFEVQTFVRTGCDY